MFDKLHLRRPILWSPCPAHDRQCCGGSPCFPGCCSLHLRQVLVFGFVILSGANILSDGSELLLEILDPGLIGGTFCLISSIY